MTLVRRPRIVILGAGFGGVQVAQRLARLFPKPASAEIVLIDQNNFLLYTPMLIEVLGGQVDMLDIVTATRQISPRIAFQQGRVEDIDPRSRCVALRIGGTGMGDPMARVTIDADHLVLALGSAPNYYGIPGLPENSLSMNNLCDAVGIRNRTLALLERANAEADAHARCALLTFVVGGGGFSGVETAAALNDLVRDAARYYPRIRPEDIRVVVIEALGRLLPELDPRLADYALRKLRENRIEVMLNTKVLRASRESIELDGNRCVDMRTLIWTGGVSPVSVVKGLDCQHGKHGGLVVEPTCAVPGLPGVWALGDCADVPLPDRQGFYANTAQNATRQGKLVAENIAAALRGGSLRRFVYKPIGEAAALGRRSGVACIYGICVSGFAGWFIWRTIYLLKLPHLKQRMRVASDWTLDLVFGREIAEVPSQCFVAGICGALEEGSVFPRRPPE